MSAVLHQAWQLIMVVQVLCIMLEVDVAGINSQAVFKLANNSRQSRRHFLSSYMYKELVTGHSAKATFYPLPGYQVEVLEKASKIPHARTTSLPIGAADITNLCIGNASYHGYLSSLLNFWPLKTCKRFEAQTLLL